MKLLKLKALQEELACGEGGKVVLFLERGASDAQMSSSERESSRAWIMVQKILQSLFLEWFSRR